MAKLNKKVKNIIDSAILITSIAVICISTIRIAKTKKNVQTDNSDNKYSAIDKKKKITYVVPNDYMVSYDENKNPIGVKIVNENGKTTYYLPLGYLFTYDENNKLNRC